MRAIVNLLGAKGLELKSLLEQIAVKHLKERIKRLDILKPSSLECTAFYKINQSID